MVPFYLRVQSSHLQIRLCSVNCSLPVESWVLTTLGPFTESFDALQKIPHFLLWFWVLGGLWRMPHHVSVFGREEMFIARGLNWKWEPRSPGEGKWSQQY